ncbi:hypothetical protein QFC21_005009 [Naganishia friedmannii]|uniref:Uncharacterized protein n=1 Tax=Naganishia friedmannii TaxID=89922 RepID=A0ACC2VC48_9TREE|nr:hypothetical protein QFC21_005009 [Naganishia friedmannii]
MTSPIYPQAQHMGSNASASHTLGPQPMMREISHDGQIGGTGGISYASAASPVHGGQQQQQQQQQMHQQQSPPAGQQQHGINTPSQLQNQQAGVAAAAGNAGNQAAPPMNLASVLHYLQSEWRRWERDRNEWEIERAEMRARIALLEGERRSAENLKMDMMRRVKMLEFALKQERSKSLSGTGTVSAANAGTIGGAGGVDVGLAHLRGPQSAGAALPGAHHFTGMASSKVMTLSPSNSSSAIPGEKKDASGSAENVKTASDLASQNTKKVNGSVPSPPEMADKKPLTSAPASTSRAGSVDGAHALGSAAGTTGTSPWRSTVSMPIRDPKSRARSRDYLKQCLQEISYLTSPAAMNPLPNRLPLTLTVPTSTSDPSSISSGQTGAATSNAESAAQALGLSLASGTTILEVPERPRKTLSEGPFPPSQPGMIGLGMKGVDVPVAETASTDPAGPATGGKAEPVIAGLSNLAQEVVAEEEEAKRAEQQEHVSQTSSSPEVQLDLEQGKVLTAIYKPESKEAWKQALKQAHEQAEKTKSGIPTSQGSSESSSADSGDALEIMSNSSADTDVTAIHDDDLPVRKGWRPARQLKSHLDAVQAVAFGPEGIVVSGSWDCTVKVWRLAKDKSSGRPHPQEEVEPQVTFRGHLAPVTSLAVSAGSRRVFSGSLDSSIRVWNLPSPEYHTYSPHDPKLEDETLVGHTDSVWALALLPSAMDEPEGYLVSASADGSVKVWSTTGEAGTSYPLVSGWKYDGTADHDDGEGADSDEKREAEAKAEEQIKRPVPVALGMYYPDLTMVLVGYNTGVIKLFEIKTGREVIEFENKANGASLTDVVCHSTLPYVVASMNDGTLRIHDAKTGKVRDTIQAHSSTINALRIDPTSSSDIVTAGDDLSIKVWNLESLTCTNEWTAHRKKGEQGVLALDVCEDTAAVASATGKDGRGRLAALMSGGADGTVRLYSKA